MKRNLVVSGWVAAAVVAVGAGIGAVALAQGGTLAPPTEPMSEESVLDALEEANGDDDATPDESPAPSPEASPAPSSPAPTGALDEVPTGDAAGGEEVIATDGGSVLARCTGAEVELVWWVAAQGWRAVAVEPGPGASATFGFTDDDDDDDGLHYRVTCVDGVPTAAQQTDDDDADD
jgi:hypothetical protein